MIKRSSLFFVILCAVHGQLFAGALLKGLQPQDKIFTTAADKRKKQLEGLQEELKGFQEQFVLFEKRSKPRLAEIATQINVTKANIKTQPQNEEFLNAKLSIYNDLYQTIKDQDQLYKQFVVLVEEHIVLLQELLQDPDLKEYLSEYSDEQRSMYQFKTLQMLRKMVLELKKQVEHLEQQETNIKAELESRKKSASAAQLAYERKREDLRQFLEAPEQKSPEEMFGFNEQQKTDLLNLQEELAHEKNELARLQLDVTKQKADQINTKLHIEKSRFDILKKIIQRVKPLVRVRGEDVAAARVELNKKKQQSFNTQENLRRDANFLTQDNKRRLQEIKKFGEQHNIVLDELLDSWGVEPKQTAAAYVNISALGNLNSQYLLVEREREFLEAKRALEEEKLRHEEVQISVRNTFHGIRAGRFDSAEAFDQEIGEYDALKANIDSTISRFKERENAVTALLSVQKRAQENIQGLLEDVQEKRASIFKADPKAFSRVVFLVREAQGRVQKQIASIEKSIGLYRDIIATAESTREQVTFIASELQETVGVLKRSEHAIKWMDAKSFIPDIKQFFSDLRFSISQLSFRELVGKTRGAFPLITDLIWFLVKLVLLFLGLLFFRIFAQMRLYKLLAYLKELRGLNLFSLLARAFLDFVMKYYLLLSLWFVLYLLVWFGPVLDSTVQILFYLASIPLFLYLSNRFLAGFIAFNASHGYAILTQSFQRRFSVIVSILLYSTVIIQLFRKAFMLGMQIDSKVPVILVAVNFIILQICLIFLITKDQVLSLIPDTTGLWKKVRAQVDRFFYLILACLIAVIIMSHPNVGFGQLVLYVLSRLALTVICIPVFFWAQSLLKRISSEMFFVSEDDVAKERFPSAKSWYGLFVIFSFLGLLFVGFVFVARIWGWPVTFQTIYDWFGSEIIPGFRGDEGVIISATSLLKVLLFIISGFLLAFAFNKFVLRRIFDLLLVESGMQHAIVGLTRYAIILTVIVIGLQSVGLGGLSRALLFGVLAVGWIVREPLGDLVAYFILLVQRPLKIGDYVEIDEKSFGVVRRITPRSTILRQKNSMTIVVPNSQILVKAVKNWNYTSGFVAINDIFVNVFYKEDPDRVIEVMRAAIETHPNILKSPKPVVRLDRFGEHSFVFLVRGYISSHYTLDMWTIASDVRLKIIRALRENGIDIAVPVTVWREQDELASEKKQLKIPQDPSKEKGDS